MSSIHSIEEKDDQTAPYTQVQGCDLRATIAAIRAMRGGAMDEYAIMPANYITSASCQGRIVS